MKVRYAVSGAWAVLKIVGLAVGGFAAICLCAALLIALLTSIPTFFYWLLMTKIGIGASLTFLPVEWRMPGFTQVWAVFILLGFVFSMMRGGVSVGKKAKDH